MKTRFLFALAGGFSASALMPITVAAQTAPAPATQAATATASATSTEVGEVIVTATRHNERLLDVPAQVSTVSGDLLQSMKLRTLADFAALTPGLSFQTTTPTSNLLVLRGITTGGAQLGSAVGLYLDDAPVGSSTPFGAGAQAININTFDLKRVEVLNGPQGTLFGSNSLGGAIRYISAPPELGVFDGHVEGEGGATAHGGGNGAARAAINLPLGDKVALRLEGVDAYDSGWVDDPTHGRHNQGDDRILQGRAALLIQATADLNLTLSGYAERARSNGLDAAFRDFTTHQPTAGDYNQSFASAQPSEVQYYLASGLIDWNLHWAKLTSVTAYQDLKSDTVSDLALAYSAILSSVLGPIGNEPYIVPADDRTKRFTQEVRLASNSNQHFEWIAGAFYSHEDTHQSIGVFNTADPQGFLLGLPLGQFELPSTAAEYAVFANATTYLTRTLDFTVGVRESWDDQVFTSSGAGLLINPTAPYTPVVSTGRSDQSTTTYLFNLRYRPTSQTTLYARAASGYRPGGPNLITGGANTGNPSFAADSLWNYELGLKQGVSGGRGFLNVSVYHIDWSNIQQVENVGGVNQFVNAGDATVNGVESSASYRIIPALSLMASGAYTDAKLTGPEPILGIDYSGARLPLSPRFSGAIAGLYRFSLNDKIAGDVSLAYRYIGDRDAGYPGSVIQPLYRLAAYNVVDLTASFRSRGWEISPYIKNIFDTRGEVSASTITNQYVPTAPVPVTLAQPRTFGAVISRDF